MQHSVESGNEDEIERKKEDRIESPSNSRVFTSPTQTQRLNTCFFHEKVSTCIFVHLLKTLSTVKMVTYLLLRRRYIA